MKKLLLVIGILMLGSFMKAESLDDSLNALASSVYVSLYSQVLVSSVDLSGQSSESSNTETNRREREKEKQKEKIQSLINKKDVKAEELFSAQGLKTYNLNANDKITLENTAAGVVVGKLKETVAVIVMDEKFDNLTSREKRL